MNIDTKIDVDSACDLTILCNQYDTVYGSMDHCGSLGNHMNSKVIFFNEWLVFRDSTFYTFWYEVAWVLHCLWRTENGD